MRVFVTGGSGFVGSAVVRELIDAGHQVTGLARSDSAAASLTAAGAAVHRGSLADLDSLRGGAAAADGVIHLAFTNPSPTTDYLASCRAEAEAVRAMGETLAGSGRPFVVTSMTAGLPQGRLATEDDQASPQHPRSVSEREGLPFAERGVRAVVVRLARSVHDRGDQGFVPGLIDIARARGASAYVGDGTNRWSAVHRLDAARLYRLALETAPAGARLHAVDDEDIPFRAIADVIGRHLGLPVTSIPPEEAEGHFGWLARFVPLDNPVSGEGTRQQLGWQPTHPSFLADLDEGHYFAAQPAVPR